MNTNQKIQVNIVTGFLGSGKTTAIIQLLKQKKGDEQWAVIINEFGKVSIDFEAFTTRTSTNEKYFEISGGCICCSAKDNFRQNLAQIIDQNRFQRIIIEPSGLGGADMISEIINENNNLVLNPIIALVPTDYLQLERLKINPIFKSQLVAADILVLSKCDLEADSKKLDSTFRKLKLDYPGKLLYTKALNGKIDERLLTHAKPNKIPKSKFDNVFFSGAELNDSNHTSLCFKSDANNPVNTESLLNLLHIENYIVRAKGFLNNGSGWCLFNYTLGSSTTEPWISQQQNKLVVIAETKSDKQLADLQNKLNVLLHKA